MMLKDTEKLERNIRLYRWYLVATSTLPWLPVFFLYFNETLSLDGVIKLGAIYYLSVVLFEIPSGYFSDRIGRRPTLICSALFLLLSYSVFIVADSFLLLVVGEVFLAAGIAFQSGCDTALLYDSLVKLKRESEYATHEATAQQYGLLALSLSCFVGGWLGSIDLVYPYIASLIPAGMALALTLLFVEPVTAAGQSHHGFMQQLIQSVKYLKDPLLRWLLFFFLLAYGLSHIAYEFYQPYIRLLDTQNILSVLRSDNAPLISGIVIGLSQFGGALGARASLKLYQQLGLRRLLVGCTLIQSLVIGGMALILKPAMLLIIILRNFPMAATRAPRLAAIAPNISSAHRATYLSMESLTARLFLSVALYSLAQLIDDQSALNETALSTILGVSTIAGLIGVVILALTGKK